VSHNEIQVSLDLLNKLEDELNNLYHLLEDEDGITDTKFRVYDKKMDDLFRIKRELKEEIWY
jgi:hypothetical protein